MRRLQTIKIILIVLALSTGVQSLAQTSTTTTTATTTSAPETRTDTSVAPSSVNQGALTTETQTRITNLASNIANRVDAAEARLLQIADRLERRINKSAASGLDVESARASLQTARDTLATVNTAAAALDQRIFATVTSENPYQDWPELRGTFIQLKTNLQTIRNELLISARSLQTTAPGGSMATTTPNE